MKNDTIFIKGVPFFAKHGVFSEERTLGQKFILSMELSLPLYEAGNSDDLTKSVHYGEVTDKVLYELTNHTFSLIEAACEHAANCVLTNYPLVDAVRVTVEKPGAPVSFSCDHLGVSVYRKRHQAMLSIGSNLGDQKAHLDYAIKRLKEHKKIFSLKASEYIVTKPYGYVDQPDFLNGAVLLTTSMEPEELLSFMQEIEFEQKRTRTIHWGPRTLDLDLIYYDHEVIDTDRLSVPHPQMQKRAFVLEPVCKLTPKWRHPLLHKTIEELYHNLLETTKEGN